MSINRNNMNSGMSLLKIAGLASAVALAGFVGYGLTRPTTYQVEGAPPRQQQQPQRRANQPSTYEVINLSAKSELIRQRIMKTYSYLFSSVAITGLSSYLLYKQGISKHLLNYMSRHPILYTLFNIIGSVGCLFATLKLNYKSNKKLKHVSWILFNVMVSLNISILKFITQLLSKHSVNSNNGYSNIINQAAMLTGVTMSGMSCVAMAAPNNYFLKYGSLLGYGLSLLSGLSLIEYFFPNNNIISNINILCGLTFYSLYFVYDTQKMVFNASRIYDDDEGYNNNNRDGNDDNDDNDVYDPINEQMGLYLDSVNFFWEIIKLLMKNEEEKEKKKRKNQENEDEDN